MDEILQLRGNLRAVDRQMIGRDDSDGRNERTDRESKCVHVYYTWKAPPVVPPPLPLQLQPTAPALISKVAG